MLAYDSACLIMIKSNCWFDSIFKNSFIKEFKKLDAQSVDLKKEEGIFFLKNYHWIVNIFLQIKKKVFEWSFIFNDKGKSDIKVICLDSFY